MLRTLIATATGLWWRSCSPAPGDLSAVDRHATLSVLLHQCSGSRGKVHNNVLLSDPIRLVVFDHLFLFLVARVFLFLIRHTELYELMSICLVAQSVQV